MGAPRASCTAKLAWTGCAGFADVAAGPDVLYRIASITKTFTGTAITQLRDARRLDLDDPLVKWLPELADCATPRSIGSATIRRLLSHESGLVSDPPGTDFYAQPPSYEGLAARTPWSGSARSSLRCPPNTGAALVGHDGTASQPERNYQRANGDCGRQSRQ
jgi:CubicO group peptidase (beta-lactamase class C family)